MTWLLWILQGNVHYSWLLLQISSSALLCINAVTIDQSCYLLSAGNYTYVMKTRCPHHIGTLTTYLPFPKPQTWNLCFIFFEIQIHDYFFILLHTKCTNKSNFYFVTRIKFWQWMNILDNGTVMPAWFITSFHKKLGRYLHKIELILKLHLRTWISDMK